MKGRRVSVAALPPALEDRSWAARAEALKRERPAQLAIVFALLALLAMLCGWVAVLIAPGGNPRLDPVFWLMMAPLMVWVWGAQSCAPWVVRTLWLVLLLAPCLSLLAMFVAPALRQAALLRNEGPYLATPLALLIVFGLTTMAAMAGLVALRRSSLPGGTRPIHTVTPGTTPVAARTLAPEARSTLMLGSLPFSGALINSIFFALVATLDPVGPWPAVLGALTMLGVTVVGVAVLVMRGGYRLGRRLPGATADLRRGWRLGMGCAVVLVPALWAWPAPLAARLAFSCFMVPMAIAAVWGGCMALRALPRVAGEA